MIFLKFVIEEEEKNLITGRIFCKGDDNTDLPAYYEKLMLYLSIMKLLLVLN